MTKADADICTKKPRRRYTQDKKWSTLRKSGGKKPLRLHIYNANSILIWQEKYLNGKPNSFGGHQQMQVVF